MDAAELTQNGIPSEHHVTVSAAMLAGLDMPTILAMIQLIGADAFKVLPIALAFAKTGKFDLVSDLAFVMQVIAVLKPA